MHKLAKTNKMIVEICANSYMSAINAEKAGADRIELCSELSVGGITPSHGLIKQVVKNINIPINVLIRPRSGDFTYSNDEFEVMKQDILFCKEQGCNGIVSGILLNENSIDLFRTKELIELAKPLSFTFHRAFDWVKNPLNIIEKLVQIGVQRVLTSGQQSAAIEGIELLKSLQNICEDKMVILPGGGINNSNVASFKKAKFKEIHFSATKLHKTLKSVKLTLNSPLFYDETTIAISDFDKIKEIINLVK